MGKKKGKKKDKKDKKDKKKKSGSWQRIQSATLGTGNQKVEIHFWQKGKGKPDEGTGHRRLDWPLWKKEGPGDLENFGVQDPVDAPKRRVRLQGDPENQWREVVPEMSFVVEAGMADSDEPNSPVNRIAEPPPPEGAFLRHVIWDGVQCHSVGFWTP